MKKVTLTLGALVITALAGCASYNSAINESEKEQEVAEVIRSTSPVMRALVITGKMVQELGLTEVQTNKVALINEDFSTRYNILIASNNPKIEKRAEFVKLTEEKNTELKKVLNNAQITKWNNIRATFWEQYRIQ